MNKAKYTNLSKNQEWPKDLDQNNEDTELKSPLPKKIYVDLSCPLYKYYNEKITFFADYEEFCDLEVEKGYPTQKEFAL